MEILGLNLPLWLLLTPVVLYIYEQYTRWPLSVFKTMPGVKILPGSPSLALLRLLRKGIVQVDREAVGKHGKLLGGMLASRPILMVADVEVLRQIQVKQFTHFPDRINVGIVDKTLGRSVNLLKDEEWKRVRNILTPAFSSGKLRRMKHKMNRCSKVLVENLRENTQSHEPFNVKDHMGAFSMDVIASTAFGLDIDSQREKDNPFITHAKKAFNFSIKNPIMLLLFLLPSALPLVTRLGLTFFPKDTTNFFSSITEQAMSGRTEEDRKTQVDFLQLMVNAHQDDEDAEDDPEDKPDESIKESTKKGLSHDDILSQALIFFIAGYSTIADCLTFTLYSLAVNPDIQERVYEEIKDTLQDDKELDYDTLVKMKYLDMVLQESLRLYPPVTRTDRVCTKGTEVNGIHIPKGMWIAVLIQAIHMDPELWPDPDKFDPERFAPELKAERDPNCWQPFGVGPRHCIGMRLALMEIKTGLAYILREFRVKPCAKTNIPIKRDPASGQPLQVILAVEQRDSGTDN